MILVGRIRIAVLRIRIRIDALILVGWIRTLIGIGKAESAIDWKLNKPFVGPFLKLRHMFSSLGGNGHFFCKMDPGGSWINLHGFKNRGW